jgi:type I restriction enzyme S subunit
MATSQDFVNWVCGEALEPWFLAYALMAEGEHIREFGRGTTHTTIYFPEVLAFHICLPPLAEQRRIVEKVEVLLAGVNAARERLAKVPAILKRFRNSILAAACAGRLTRQDDAIPFPVTSAPPDSDIGSRNPSSPRSSTAS